MFKKGPSVSSVCGSYDNQPIIEEEEKEEPKATQPIKHETTDDKIKRSFFDKYIDKIKEFLDNAE